MKAALRQPVECCICGESTNWPDIHLIGGVLRYFCPECADDLDTVWGHWAIQKANGEIEILRDLFANRDYSAKSGLAEWLTKPDDQD